MAEKILKKDEFFELIASEAGGNSTPASAKKYYDALYRLILKQLELHGEILLEDFVTLKLYQTNARYIELNDIETSEMVKRFVSPKIKITFKPSGVFERAINENDFKKVEIKRKKKRWKNKVEQREHINAKRRKPKVDPRKGFLEMFNDIEKEENE